MRLPLRIALSHHTGPRRLISFSSSDPGMIPRYAVRHASSWVSATAVASVGLARRISIRVVLMARLKQPPRARFKPFVNGQLMMLAGRGEDATVFFARCPGAPIRAVPIREYA